MKLTFHGAASTVTGSKYLLKDGTGSLLVDCGMFQGLKPLRLRNWDPLPFSPKELNAVVLTHAHLDHSGCLPLLVRQGFTGKIFCTAGTFALCKILLPDAGKLQEEEAAYANRKGYSKHSPALALFTRRDAERALELFKVVEFDRSMVPVEGFKVTFRRAGHIIGASFLEVEYGGARLLFSGDLGRPHDRVMLPPDRPGSCDLLIVESTYGDRDHVESDPKEILGEVIRRAVERGGTVVVPAFAVGRSQSLLHLLRELKDEGRIPKVPIFLDSPMAIEATEIFCRFPQDHRLTADQAKRVCEVAEYVESPEDSYRVMTLPGPKIILSASGMATGGRVLHHLSYLAPEAKNVILLTGFQAEGTRGDSLLKGATSVKIHGRPVPVHAEVVNLEGLSAHADQSEILEWLGEMPRAPRQVYIVHGEPKAAFGLKKVVEERFGWQCQVPQHGDSVSLKDL